MTRTLIGFDYTDTPCVKITKANFDPITTKDSERHKFHFSSKWANNVEIAGLDTVQGGNYSEWTFQFWPPGSTTSNFKKARYSFGDGDLYAWYWKASFFPNLRYRYPLFSFKRKNSNGRYNIDERQEYVRGYANPVGWKGGFIAWGGYRTGGWEDHGSPNDFRIGDKKYTWNLGLSTIQSGDGPGRLGVLTVFNLPGDDAPLDGPTGVGNAAAGSTAIEITPSRLRVAKPGYKVTDGPRFLAFSSENAPMQVIAAGDVAVPKGTSFVPLPISVAADTMVECVFYEGSTITYPMTTAWEFEGGLEYWIANGRLNFNNPSGAGRCRYMVFAHDTQAPTSGTYEVLRQFNWQGEQHVQFLRPGAASPPRFADIALDSRWPAIQILKEGYFEVDGGAKTKEITYNASGFFPYVLYMVHYKTNTSTPREGVRPPFIRYQRLPKAFSGDCSYCKYNASKATFYTYRGRPAYTWLDGKSRTPREVDTDFTPIGIRYYVLGIPT
ncbi:hypothetical protein [Mycoplana ramosa]|uniref:Uncharacterized protein n=1 Tax=Mycoplana ramosa TaxID=40837 RepID=A0ABW3Z1Z3_MYCRA